MFTVRIKMLVLLLLCLGLILANLWLGSVSFSLERLCAALLGKPIEAGDTAIIWELRMPKIGAALLAGASLSVSGLLMQTFFRNPIAGPFVLGISSGASLGVALALMATSTLATVLGTVWVQSPAFVLVLAILGASLVLLLLLLVSWRVADINTLLILGLMFGSASSALVALLQYFSHQEALKQYVLWSMGSLGGITPQELSWLLPLCVLALLGTLGCSKWLDALLLGEQYAISMGVPVRKAQQVILILTALLVGSITAFCGPIAFVGIAVPHLARLLFRTYQHFILIIACCLMGMLVLLVCQLIAQLPGSARILPINVVTSFLGAPMVIYLVLSGRTIKS
ncbi:MAG: FecCD family ABC transporter permease [Aureispira sp.]